MPWASRKSSSASTTGRQGRAGSLSQHEEIRLHKHLRVVRILLLNVIAVLAMWTPISVLLILIYLDGRRPIEDTNFFLKSHHFIWSFIIAQLNTVINPLLYGVFSENFRACFSKFWSKTLSTGGASGERCSGGGGVAGVCGYNRKSSKSLEVLQDRLGTNKNSSFKHNKQPKKSSSCSIGSIIEIPNSEKL